MYFCGRTTNPCWSVPSNALCEEVGHWQHAVGRQEAGSGNDRRSDECLVHTNARGLFSDEGVRASLIGRNWRPSSCTRITCSLILWSFLKAWSQCSSSLHSDNLSSQLQRHLLLQCQQQHYRPFTRLVTLTYPFRLYLSTVLQPGDGSYGKTTPTITPKEPSNSYYDVCC